MPFRKVLLNLSGLRPESGAQPQMNKNNLAGRPEAFHTSGRQSRGRDNPNRIVVAKAPRSDYDERKLANGASEMSAVLEINEETAEVLTNRAKAEGQSVDEYLKSLLGVGNEREGASDSEVEEFMAAMESLADEDVEPLPSSFSRADIYFPEG